MKSMIPTMAGRPTMRNTSSTIAKCGNVIEHLCGR